jgi:hypothetical protein
MAALITFLCPQTGMDVQIVRRRQRTVKSADSDIAVSFDHLVGERQQCRRNSNVECLGSPEVENHLELCREHDRQIARLSWRTPLWVKSDRSAMSALLPLYPPKPTFIVRFGMSVWCLLSYVATISLVSIVAPPHCSEVARINAANATSNDCNMRTGRTLHRRCAVCAKKSKQYACAVGRRRTCRPRVTPNYFS